MSLCLALAQTHWVFVRAVRESHMNAIGSFFRKRSLLYIALFLTLISGAGAFYHAQERLFRQEVNANLLSIAALKAQHIEQWRNERISDGATLSADNLLVGYVTRWFSQPDTMLTAKLQMRLLAIRQSQHYQDVILADANGQMRLHAEASAPLIPINAIELTAIQQAFHSRRPILTDVHVDSPNDAFPHINIVAPLFTESAGLPLGVIILRSNLDYFLYPMLQAWPVASKTAETLLVDLTLELNDYISMVSPRLREKIAAFLKHGKKNGRA